MAAVDRSVLEEKGVAELKEIAKTLDIKTSGLKKAEIIDAIASNGSRSNSKPKASSEGARPREQATDVSDVPAPPGNGVRDEGAHDERDQRDERRRPQGRNQNPRNRPREKAEPRGEGRRRRRRGRGGSGGGQGGGDRGVPHYMREERWEDLEDIDDSDAEVRTGILDLLPEGYGFLRTSGYLPGDKDVYVSVSQVRRFKLRKGDEVVGSVRSPKESEKYQAMLKIHTINGIEPEQT